ncbi:NTP transferase domain-containing protein [Candidatus Uhrbacteria bacterium]|nr:NTP transferase domain-containing protein [Candidatus Uhrbacteria bacterium]
MSQVVAPQSTPVVILCGGKGTRLREETEFKPKPMVEIGGRPILWHIMKLYAHQGYRDFILCLGYRGHQIKEYFLNHHLLHHDFRLDLATNATTVLGEDAADDFQITFVDTGVETLTGERLLRAAKYITGDEFMCTYGDGVSDIALRALHAYHHEKRLSHAVVGTVTGVHPKSKYGLVNVNEHRVVTAFVQKPRLHDFTNGGFMVFQRAFLEYCRPNQMVEDAIIEATNAQQIALYPHEGFWHCMDTYQDKEDLEHLWATDPKWKIWEQPIDIPTSVRQSSL